jgi:hypothetical protein
VSKVAPQADNEIDNADKALKNSQPMFLRTIEINRALRKGGVEGVVQLKKFCMAFDRKRWGDPIKFKTKWELP